MVTLIEEGETMPDRISQQKADELFDKDYEHHKAAAMKIPGYDKASGMQKAAGLIDLTFNMGPAWASGFPAFKKAFAAGNYEQAGNELIDSAWYGQVGRRAPTIVNLIKGKGADNVAYLKDVPKPAPGSSQPQIAIIWIILFCHQFHHQFHHPLQDPKDQWQVFLVQVAHLKWWHQNQNQWWGNQ